LNTDHGWLDIPTAAQAELASRLAASISGNLTNSS